MWVNARDARSTTERYGRPVRRLEAATVARVPEVSTGLGSVTGTTGVQVMVPDADVQDLLAGDRPGGPADPRAGARLAPAGVVSRPVLTAVTDRWEGRLVTVLERATDARRDPPLCRPARAARRGRGGAGRGRPGVGRPALARPCGAGPPARPGVAVVGVYPPGDEAAERQLRQLGVEAVVAADADGTLLQATVDSLTGPGPCRVPGSDPAGRGRRSRPGLQGVPPQLTRSRACWSTRHGRVPEWVPARGRQRQSWAPATPTTRAS